MSIHFFAFRFALRTLMCYLTEMKHSQGGGGYSHFFCIRRLRPSICRSPPKNIRNFKHLKKLFEILATQKIIPNSVPWPCTPPPPPLWKHYTINFWHFTQFTSQNTSLRMEITKFINKLPTNLYIYRKCYIVHNNIGPVEQFIVIVKRL